MLLLRYLHQLCQLVKIRENGKVIGKEKRIIYGNPDLCDLETTDVENFTRNAGGIDRHPMVLARILLFSLTIPNWDTTGSGGETWVIYVPKNDSKLRL